MHGAGICAAIALFSIIAGMTARAQVFPYTESPYGPRYYLGDEDARLGHAHLVRGNYGLGEVYFRRAVETTPQNGAAWLGLAACYDRLGRFDLAETAYRRAEKLGGVNPALLNNHGYSHLLRGQVRKARSLFYRAAALAPDNPTIVNNITMLEAGQGYFWGTAPYLWGWPQ